MAVRGEGHAIKERSMPLDQFPAAHQERIAALVARPTPPPRWLELCDGLVQIPSRAWWEWHWQRGKYPYSNETRPGLPPRLRQRVIDRDGYVCGLCGGDVEPTDVHIDHIHPYSLGGSDALDNLQVAHSTCNVRKGNRV